MTEPKTLNDLAVQLVTALDAAKVSLNAVNVAIEELQSDRRAIELAPPHSDDIAAAFRRGINAAANRFENEFAGRLADTFAGEGGAAAAAPSASADVLRLEATKPDRETIMARSMKGQMQPELNVGALAFFLRDRITDELPALVDRLCPAARSGLRQADRNSALAALDSQLFDLGEERDRLLEQVQSIRSLARS